MEEKRITPELSAEERAYGLKSLKNYIFVTNEKDGSKTCYCTACRKQFSEKIPRRTYSNEDEMLFGAKHREEAPCPKCHATLQVINRGRLKNLTRLNDRENIAFFRVISAEEIWLLCYIFDRYFYDAGVKDDVLEYEAYHFRKGQKTRYFRRGWYSRDMAEIGKIREPFGYFNSCAGFIYDPYTLIGAGELESTFFRYSRFKEWMNADRFVHYLDAFSEFPRVIEMLEKQGFRNLVNEKVLRGCMCTQVCRFRTADPKKFWKLDKAELKVWKEQHRCDLEIAAVYKRLFRNEGPEKGLAFASRWGGLCNTKDREKKLLQLLKKYGFTPRQAVDYTDKRRLKEMIYSPGYYWIDYLEAAEDVGYDLTVHNVFFPRNLGTAHDEVVKARQIKTAEKEIKKSMERVAALEKQYGYSDGVYLIRPPKDTVEIVEEGNALKHCVGGYAARHAEGSTTILFMRAAKAPDKPLYTIEMNGETLRQAHGYKNRENPEDVPPAKAFLDAWLKWVKAGSKRDKNGAPKVKTADKQVKNGAGKAATGKKKGKAA